MGGVFNVESLFYVERGSGNMCGTESQSFLPWQRAQTESSVEAIKVPRVKFMNFASNSIFCL